MDKEIVVRALKLANKAMNEAKVCAWEYESDNASSMAMIELAGLILIADSVRKSAHPIHHFQVGTDMGEGKDYSVNWLTDLEANKKYLQLDEPYETGYWYAVFPDGSARLAEIEEADSSKDGVKFKVHLLDHSGETMAIKEAKWVRVNPQLR